MKSSSAFRGVRIEFAPIVSEEKRGGSQAATNQTLKSECVAARSDEALRDVSVETQTQESARIPRWKRTLDLSLIIVSFPIWLTLMLLVTAWIKIASPGPVFYRQERVGFKRKRFMVLKFRSMKVNAETAIHEKHLEELIGSNRPMTKLDAIGDPRVVPLGRLLRSTGLDELPQIFNVIRGEMSLVGPRPCTVTEFLRYDSRHRERVNAPPGLTGYWQVNGKNKTTFSEMIEMDIYYNENMSVSLDCAIIAQTIPAIFDQVSELRSRHLRKTASSNPIAESEAN